MSADSDRSRFEADVRAVLKEARPSSGPSAELWSRVAALPRVARRTGLGWARGGLGLAGTLLAVGLLLAVAGSIWVARPPQAGLTPTPSVTPFVPEQDGVGILTRAPDDRRNAWIVAASVVLLLGTASLRFSRRWRLVPLALIAPVLAGAHFASSQPGLVWGFGWGAPIGAQWIDLPPLSSGPTPVYVTVPEGDTFVVTLNVRNAGDTPLRVLGVVEEQDANSMVPRWTAVGTDYYPGGFRGLEAAHAFEPVDLAPGDYLNLYLAGRAGRCAIGRAVDPAREGFTYVGSGPGIAIAVSSMGLTWTSLVEPPFTVGQALDELCQADF